MALQVYLIMVKRVDIICCQIDCDLKFLIDPDGIIINGDIVENRQHGKAVSSDQQDHQ